MEIELLAPAGNMEKMQTAFYYGADACYLGGTNWGLRAFAQNFDDKELLNAVEYAHSLGKKCYVTLNIIARNSDFEGLFDYVLYLQKIKIDAVIVADLGMLEYIHKICPLLPIHISTQANITNKYSAKAFAELGATRIILARELSLAEIKEIRDYLPKDIELECFVHGAMCISYSGRCLLSNYFCGRDSNHGECVQACRWKYALSRKDNDSEQFEIVENEKGTYILNSKDLNLIEYLDKLAEAGVTSFKIEGRMKSSFYVATVINSYRRALDYLYFCSSKKIKYNCPAILAEELEKTSHRRYTTGFFAGAHDKEYLENSQPVQTSEFVALIKEQTCNGRVLIEMRNKFSVGDVLEVLSPKENFNKKLTITKMEDMDKNAIVVADKVQQLIYIYTDMLLYPLDILRR